VTESERIALIQPAVEGADGTWADFGAGSGAFTLALASLLGPGAVIYALDRDASALRALERKAAGRTPRIVCLPADFTGPVSLPALDGILFANSLHFQPDACRTLTAAARRLKLGGLLVVVEYDVARGNRWVPHPLPWSRFAPAAQCAGLAEARLLGTRASAYHGSMYAASCRKPAAGR
jgi:SAM-dependent methyltransferase